MGAIHEQLSHQFYQWERRGRGWQLFPEPIRPEPPFVPFQGYTQPSPAPVDDGVRPTMLSSFIQKLSRALSTETEAPEIPESPEEPDPQLLLRESLIELQASLPSKLDASKELFDQFLANVSLAREPLAFELLGTSKGVTVQFAAHPDDAESVHQQLEALFPEATFQVEGDSLANAWNEAQSDNALAVEFGLEQEFMLPLAVGKLDPFAGIVGVMARLQEGELGLFQVLFQPVENDWAESIVASVTHGDRRPLFVNHPELTDAAESKTSKPLYAVVVRIMACSRESSRLRQLACDLAGCLRVFAHPRGNELIPLSNEGYGFEEHIKDVLCRQSRRSGMILNRDELIGFVHLPASSVRSSALRRDSGKTKKAPSIACQEQGVILGDNIHAGQSLPIRLTPDQRFRHTHIIGASGSGKSTLLFNLISQDIQNGEGVGVLDPHGDLIDRILGIIPPSRIKDVILVDLADTEFPIGFNILSTHTEKERNLLASDLVSIFRRFSSSWGDQMDIVLLNAILPFLEGHLKGTLGDVRRFLLESKYRDDCLKTVRNPELVYYWKNVFPRLTGGKSIGPLLTRLQTFFSRAPIRNMMLQSENKLDFADIMDSGKIFLARLPEGLSGETDTFLLGALLMSKFQQTAIARQDQDISTRRPFWLYVDEFDHLISSSIAEILKGARKYRLGLTLAHQDLHQLQSDPKVASAVATHPCTRIAFQVSDDDARKLGGYFSSFDATLLKTLGTFQAIARVEKADFDFNLQVRPPDTADAKAAAEIRQAVVAASRERYATPRDQVEESLLAKLNSAPSEPAEPRCKTSPSESRKIQKTESEFASAVTETDSEPESETEDETHENLKNQLGIEAEGLDYTVSFEEKTPSNGRIDLVLRRGNTAVACEISVKCGIRYEVQNIHKCLNAGFGAVAMISANQRKLKRIQELFHESASKDQAGRITFYAPDHFIEKLHEWAEADPDGGKAERGKPRKRKISFLPTLLTTEERTAQEQEWLKEIAVAMKRNQI